MTSHSETRVDLRACKLICLPGCLHMYNQTRKMNQSASCFPFSFRCTSLVMGNPSYERPIDIRNSTPGLSEFVWENSETLAIIGRFLT